MLRVAGAGIYNAWFVYFEIFMGYMRQAQEFLSFALGQPVPMLLMYVLFGAILAVYALSSVVLLGAAGVIVIALLQSNNWGWYHQLIVWVVLGVTLMHRAIDVYNMTVTFTIWLISEILYLIWILITYK